MSTKHFFSSEGLVERALAGVVAANPALRCYGPAKVVYDSTWHPHTHGSILLVAGGGAGHEPGFAGFVGRGMLGASVSGDVFASPSTRPIGLALDLMLASYESPDLGAAASRSDSSGMDTDDRHGRRKEQEDDKDNKARRHPRKVIFIVLNYSGDALNFGLAREKAERAGWEAEVILVGDDVSVGRRRGARVGRRGLAAQVFVIKALGALLALSAGAEGGLDDVRKLADFGRTVAKYAGTMSVSLDHCHPPGANLAEWRPLKDGQVGLGVGIHNEPGVKLLDWAPDVGAAGAGADGGAGGEGDGGATGRLIRTMLGYILDKSDADRAYFEYDGDEKDKQMEEKKDRFVLIVNNLGGLSNLELHAVVAETLVQLRQGWGREPLRLYAGTFLSSLNAPGFSISLVNVDKVEVAEEATAVGLRRAGAESSATGRSGEAAGGGDTNAGRELDLFGLFDAPTEAVGWPGGSARSVSLSASSSLPSAPSAEETYHKIQYLQGTITASPPAASTAPTTKNDAAHPTLAHPSRLRAMLRAASDALIEAEPEITRLDTIQGDGDCGTTLKALAVGVRAAMEKGELGAVLARREDGETGAQGGEVEEEEEVSAPGLVAAVCEVVERTMGGTSGALFALYLSALSNALSSSAEASRGTEGTGARMDQPRWARACHAALESLYRYTLARPGDRTLVDALEPFVRALGGAEGPSSSWEDATKAAWDGARRTASMEARLGRAAYVGAGEEDGEDGGDDGKAERERGDKRDLPDPGAVGVATILQGLWKGWQGQDG